ncbi:hypothetical protein GGR58DRAFT_117321 [Xylaria digitata]|nr:hypothetical protein GGR58DRAFT_117321 [Xylaria digitata]
MTASSTANRTSRPPAFTIPTRLRDPGILPRTVQVLGNNSSSLTLPGSNSSASQVWLSPILVTSHAVGLQDEAIRLLVIFRGSLATWMDIFDFSETYQREVCCRAAHSRLVLCCICAITAKHLSLMPSGEMWQPTASRYYIEALQHLITALGHLGSGTNGDELTASMLLGSYEMISASGAPYISHYQGARDLIRSQNISATSSGIDRANFFIYARHEISIALVREGPLQLDPNDWNMPPQPPTGVGEDEMGNYLLWLSGKAINLIYSNDVTPANRNSLIDRVDDWYTRTTETLRGISYGGLDEEGLQKLFFAVPAAAAAMLWYHLTRILLLAEPELLDPASEALVQNHTKSILDIAISRITPGVRCFAIMPVYFAGKHDAEVSRKMRAYTILDEIQRDVGHNTQDRMRSLSRVILQAPRLIPSGP